MITRLNGRRYRDDLELIQTMYISRVLPERISLIGKDLAQAYEILKVGRARQGVVIGQMHHETLGARWRADGARAGAEPAAGSVGDVVARAATPWRWIDASSSSEGASSRRGRM